MIQHLWGAAVQVGDTARRTAWRGIGLFRPLTLADVAHRCARVRTSAEAIEVSSPLRMVGFEQRVWTYADVDRFVSLAAGAMARAGVRSGSRVVICTANGVDQPLLTLAAIRAGAVAVPLNHRLRAAELEHIIADSGAEMLVVDPHVLGTTLAEGVPAGVRDLLVTDGLASGPELDRGALERCPVRAMSLSDLFEGAAAFDPRARPADGERCVVLYTSGTTGAPKGATLSSDALLSSIKWLLTAGLLDGHSMVIGLPGAHVMGFVAFLFALLAGVRLTHFDRFDADRVLDKLTDGVEGFFGVPSMYQMLAEAGASDRDLQQVRVFASAADVMPGALIDEFRASGALFKVGPLRLPAVFVEMYGSVELSGAAMFRIALPLTVTEESFVGFPLPGFSAQVRDREGRDLPANTAGELWVRGPGVFRGYFGDANVGGVDDGWFNTGDLARRSRVGLVRFVGREKEVIKAGGYSVYPPEVQGVLLRHPSIAKAAVFALRHPSRGEEVAAVVCAEDGGDIDPDEVIRWAKTQMASYKAPRQVFVIPAEEMPYGATGKILKNELIARFAPAEA
jgi:acyl-CoA synthetase (AMP-forming)/AMP-acid ligase II